MYTIIAYYMSNTPVVKLISILVINNNLQPCNYYFTVIIKFHFYTSIKYK